MATNPNPTLDDGVRALLEQPNLAFVSTLREDGSILTVPTWVDVDGDEVLLNTEERRRWLHNVRDRGHITITLADRENPYEYVSISGEVASEATEGAFEHGDRMAKKYLGQDRYPFHREGDVRVLLRIRPQRVQHVR
ncbi:TIGR03618 family F420-dependent PPOX class oxidoreductase [Conexibacter sp. W3-3-2]|uniref:PPOX class F420-dependent oxidoreductase n=1 Tax=Conexibacter sp. W3-3-2 TaxID=2675227 RepID=UPI0012B9FF00|nr:PPOX class F420-dependent oxidoreductase [Conexibacter sp. W3-3-2]MTD43571.1 TIGR03618 family F420-dependent PPOX class oxidoreductase [Conexibacter sp. W3-3-2]